MFNQIVDNQKAKEIADIQLTQQDLGEQQDRGWKGKSPTEQADTQLSQDKTPADCNPCFRISEKHSHQDGTQSSKEGVSTFLREH